MAASSRASAPKNAESNAILQKPVVDLLRDGFHRIDVLMPQRFNHLPNCAGHRGGRDFSLDNQYTNAHVVFVLRRRQVHGWLGRVAHVIKSRVARDPNDLKILPFWFRCDIDALPERITISKHSFREIFADDGDSRCLVVIAPGKPPASNQAYSQGAKRSWHDDSKIRLARPRHLSWNVYRLFPVET